MQTFLPYPSFLDSALVLDKKRCWKQVVEASQIIAVLEGRKTGWANHPAVKMWSNHIEALKAYFNCFLHVCKTSHGINTKYEEYPISGDDDNNAYFKNPWWLGKEKFHRAMRSRLIEKDRDFYLPLFTKDEGYNGGLYWWPNMETKDFYIIKPKNNGKSSKQNS